MSLIDSFNNMPYYIRASLFSFIIMIASLILLNAVEENSFEQYHIHADFKVFLNGKPINFSKPEYMSSQNHELNKYVHLHDMNGDVIHFHSRDVGLKDFFESINMTLKDNCLIIKGKAYCNLKLYVNRLFIWFEEDLSTYTPKDLDRILITDGIGNIEEQKAMVTSDACIYSNKCFWKTLGKNINQDSESGCVSGSSCPV
jgi:hypothetical protein